jgi:hypothetical protein
MFKRVVFPVAAAGLFVLFSGSFAEAASCQGPGWVRVSPECPVPGDLTVGDSIEITVGSAVFAHQKIVKVANCRGEKRYFTSASQTGCGFHKTFTAYRRLSNDSLNALKALKHQ